MLGEYGNHLLSAGRGEGTARQYVAQMERLRTQHPNLLRVTTADLEAYLAARRHLSAEYRKLMRSAFRSFYRWAHKLGRIGADPAYDLEPVRVILKPARIAADEAVQLGLLTADDSVTAMILLARYGCLRLSELTTLHMSAREGDVLRVFGKGEKVRLVPANAELLHALVTLERTLGGNCYYFPGRNGSHMHPASVNKIITRHLGVNPHSLRHAGATAAYLATGNLEAVRQLLGHASIATTQRYLHVGMDAVREAANGTALPRLGRFPATTIPTQTYAA